MSKVGFGAYRISNRSEEHREALEYALKEGCRLIDTSSNYTDGESEELVGEIINDTKSSAIIISKVGYIQGQNIDIVKNQKLDKDIVVISDSLMHSIHPEFIENQLERSLDRLNIDTLDSYLLHNPEYYLKTDGSSKDEMYHRIEKALVYLEEQVSKRKIKSYGISSNTFVNPIEDHESINILNIVEIIKKNNLKNFKYIQFPMNLLELGATIKQFGGLSLFEIAKENDLTTMINRPFNAFSENGLIRLCEYDVADNLNDDYALKEFLRLNETLKEKWNEEREDDTEEIDDLAIYNQIKDIWYKQYSVDSVEQIFYQYYFPMLTSVWGRSLDPNEAKPFFELFELAVDYAKKNMNERALEFKKVAKDSGLIDDKDKDLQSLAVNKYFELGADFVLCGMKSKAYVENLKNYF